MRIGRLVEQSKYVGGRQLQKLIHCSENSAQTSLQYISDFED